MRRLIESTLMTVDGVVSDPPAWLGDYLNEEFTHDSLERLSNADALLMGRGTYEIFAKVWPNRPGELAEAVNRIPKYVFSSTLAKADWNNTTVLRGDAVRHVADLKAEPGKDLAVWGHGALARTLLQHHLIDELQISIVPVIAGHGTPFFHENEAATLAPLASKTFATGVVSLRYRPS